MKRAKEKVGVKRINLIYWEEVARVRSLEPKLVSLMTNILFVY